MIEGLFDHVARVLRPSEDASGSPVGYAGETYAEAVPAPLTPNVAIVPPTRGRLPLAAGERITGQTEAFAAADFDLERNDVLDVTAGPEAPSKWRVVDLRRPRGHHTEATLEVFSGDLVEA